MNLPAKFLEEINAVLGDSKEFIDSYANPHTKAFRINTLKISDDLLLESMGGYIPVPFAKHSYYMDSEEKWGNHAFHHAGLMYFQEPSAMAAVSAYDVSPYFALDMCAAPGGKTLQLASKAQYVVSNEIIPSRAAILKSNVERMGCKNVMVTNHSPQEIESLGEIFDLVLVDAPCSGEGMFRKDEGAIDEWSEEHSNSCAQRQFAILCSADKVLKKGGTLIYSTCTFSRRENEYVVDKFMQEFSYELITPNAQVRAQTTYYSDERMRRFYPHIAIGEGQFFAALTKKGDPVSRSFKQNKFKKNKIVDEFLVATIGRTLDYCEIDGMFYVPALPMSLPLKKIVSGGVKIGRLDGKVFKPDHYFFSAFGKDMFNVELTSVQAKRYLHGEELEGDHVGYGAVTVLGAPLGGFKGSGGRYKNLYPKGLRI